MSVDAKPQRGDMCIENAESQKLKPRRLSLQGNTRMNQRQVRVWHLRVLIPYVPFRVYVYAKNGEVTNLAYLS